MSAPVAWDELVGAAYVRAGAGDDAVDGVIPSWVVRPATVLEVQACVRAASASGGALIASGTGAHLDLGAPPRTVDVLLRLDRLERVLDHQAADMTVTVEAGCRLDRLGERLASAGQWLPLDPPRPSATTAGGLVAASLSGPLRTSQGTVRDLLLGIRVVDGAGALVTGGGRVVKNVAGYDLPKLHIGALGTLGVVVEATFKVRPRPEREEAVVVSCPTLAGAAALALEVRDLEVPPLWLEICGAGEIGPQPAVAVGLAGIDAEVEAAHAAMAALVRARGRDGTVLRDGAGVRARLGSFPVVPAAAVLRVASLPARVGDLLEAALEAARTAGSAARLSATPTAGVLRIALVEPDAVPRILAELRAAVAADGGSVVIERATPAVKAGADVWGGAGGEATLMRRVKNAFDPAATFAPARYVDGL